MTRIACFLYYLTTCREFVSEAQQRLGGPAGIGMFFLFIFARARSLIMLAVDDGLSDDIIDPAQHFILPAPELGNLPEIENAMRMANSTAAGRDALAKFTVSADYVTKLVPLVEMAEDLESLSDLHRLCTIMKTLILLNDTAIIEYAVTDDVVLGVVGALECALQTSIENMLFIVADYLQTTQIFQATRQITGNTFLMNRDSRKLSRSRTP
jgi:hypothetical protein